MKATIEIQMGGAAFDNVYHREELGRILRQLARTIERHGGMPDRSLPLRDVNGNMVGRFVVTEE